MLLLRWGDVNMYCSPLSILIWKVRYYRAISRPAKLHTPSRSLLLYSQLIHKDDNKCGCSISLWTHLITLYMQDRAAQLIKVSNLCARYTKLQCTYCVTDFFCPSCRSVNCGDTDRHHGAGSSVEIPSTRYGHRYFYPSHDGFLGKPTICWHVFSLFLRARGGSPFLWANGDSPVLFPGVRGA